MSLFAKHEAERVAEVVTEIEQRTAAEIVVAEVERSDDYYGVRLFVTLMVGLVAASVAHLTDPTLEVSAVLAVQFAAGLAVWLLSALPTPLRLLLPKPLVAQAVTRAAKLAFFEYGVFATRERTGVLIFLSALEHRVIILGDEGIHARVGDPGWTEHVQTLVAAIKARKVGDGVCNVVQRLGDTLAQAAPLREDDTNELDNRVRSR